LVPVWVSIWRFKLKLEHIFFPQVVHMYDLDEEAVEEEAAAFEDEGLVIIASRQREVFWLVGGLLGTVGP
jgi:hypothetical protein